jgi:hypothetical protein
MTERYGLKEGDEKVPFLEFLEQHLPPSHVQHLVNFRIEFLEKLTRKIVLESSASPGPPMPDPVTQMSDLQAAITSDAAEKVGDESMVTPLPATTTAGDDRLEIEPETIDGDGDERVVVLVPATTTAGPGWNPSQRVRETRATQKKKTKVTNGQRGPPRRSTRSHPSPAAPRRSRRPAPTKTRRDAPLGQKTAEADKERDQPRWTNPSLHQTSPGGVWGEQRDGVWTMRARRPRRPGDSFTHVGRVVQLC